SRSLRLFSSSHVVCLDREAYRIWHQRKIQEDPEWHERRRASRCQYLRDRRAGDPEYIEYKKRWQRERSAKAEVKAHLRLLNFLYRSCTKKAWFRELPWKTHAPNFYAQGVRFHCAICGLIRKGASRLLWSAHDNEPHLCNGCYARRGWTDAMPTGYEDCRSARDVAARKQQLDGIDPSKLP
ncbi:uncharacterized protein M437DRAFT_51702, partial [Aureobasidium melanogenum CBS 110374]